MNSPGPTEGTEILWDTYGVPHIFAPDHTSLFYAYGYAQMEAHAELLIRLYAQARGRAAEFYGEQYLDEDRWVWTNGIPQRAREWATQQSPEFYPLLQAFASGLNARATEEIETLSDAARAILPLTVEDVLAHGMRVIHFGWRGDSESVETRVSGAVKSPSGSNGWAISPFRSASGHAMLLSNSHLRWGDKHTYFEVQLSAPGVSSYGAVWVGFPTLRLCFTDYVGWTQTTNGVNLAHLYRLTLNDHGYELDGETRSFEVENQVIRVRQEDGTLREEPLLIRRSEHGPVVFDRDGMTVALRVAGTTRPHMFEQFWRMGLSRNLAQFEEAMRMRQLPLFNTMYADRDGLIMYLFNTVSPLRVQGDHSFWGGVVPGDDSELIWSDDLVPYEELPRVIDPPNGWVQNCNDSPWTCTHPVVIEPEMSPAYTATPPSHTPRAQRSIRLLAQADAISLADLKEMKLSTRAEVADRFVDDLVAAARQFGGERAQRAAGILESWDRETECGSDGAFLFYCFVEAAGEDFNAIGGYAIAADSAQPLTTPCGFADPARAADMLDAQVERLEREYGSLHVLWGDVVRLRRGALDLPGNGAPGVMGAVRTAAPGSFENGTAQIESGDTFYFVLEFTDPIRAEALLGYGNWSREGSKHVTDQLEMASNKQMRPVLRQRSEIEAALESRHVFRG